MFTHVGPLGDDQQPEARITQEPSQPDMIQFDTTDGDASDLPDVPQQPLPARTPSVRSVDAKNPVTVGSQGARAHAQTRDGEASSERTPKVDRIFRNDGRRGAARRLPYILQR